MSRVLAVRGRVLPAANQAIVLKAEMEDGTIVTGNRIFRRRAGDQAGIYRAGGCGAAARKRLKRFGRPMPF